MRFRFGKTIAALLSVMFIDAIVVVYGDYIVVDGVAVVDYIFVGDCSDIHIILFMLFMVLLLLFVFLFVFVFDNAVAHICFDTIVDACCDVFAVCDM